MRCFIDAHGLTFHTWGMPSHPLAWSQPELLSEYCDIDRSDRRKSLPSLVVPFSFIIQAEVASKIKCGEKYILSSHYNYYIT